MAGCLANIQELHRRGIGRTVVSQGIEISEGAPGSGAMLTLIAAMMAFGSEVKRERIKAAMRIARRMAMRRGERCGRPKVVFDRELVASLRREGKSIRAIARRTGRRKGHGRADPKCPKRVTR